MAKTFRTLDRTISSLELQLAAARAARAARADSEDRSPVNNKPGSERLNDRPKVFFVMGIITAFSSRKRRDSIRETWMPQGLRFNTFVVFQMHQIVRGHTFFL